MRLVFLGTRALGYEGLELLIEQGHDIAAAFSVDHDITEGRTADDFARLCARHGVPFHRTDDLEAHIDSFRTLGVDLFVSLFWKRIVSSRVLATARLGGVNVHQSALPRYRGFAPQNWAILNGDVSGGVTLHWMVTRADAGDIIDQRSHEIGPDDTIADLGARARSLALEMLRERIPQIADGTAPRRAQSENEAVLAMPRRPGDGWIDWTASGRVIHDLVRAVGHPYPGAFTFRDGARLFVWRTRIGEPPFAFVAVPGTALRRADGGEGMWVSTGDGAIQLLRVQVADAQEAPAAAILRPGDRLGIDMNALLAGVRTR